MKGDIEVMRVLRQPPMGKMVVQTGTGRFVNLAEVQNEELRRRILAAIGDLLVFAGGYETLVKAGFAPPLTAAPGPAQPGEAAAPGGEPTLTPQQAAFISQLEMKRDEVRRSLETPPMAPTGLLLGRRRRTSDPARPAAETIRPLSITDQINEILQAQVEADPTLANRGIQLDQAPNGSLLILVDGQQYASPMEIPDRQVQQAIKRALTAWEKSGGQR